MPNRIIKESICTSEKISSLSDFEFRLWVGLITMVDDAGRGDARASIIKGRVFPLRDRLPLKDIESALHNLAAKGCVSLYTVDGKPYFWFPTWSQHQRIRNVKPKYPPPDNADGSLQCSAANCGELPQTAASCGLNPIQSESNPNPNPNPIQPAREAVVVAAQKSFARPLSPREIEYIEADLPTYGQEWMCKAFDIAAANAKHNYAYVKAILDRWHAQGSCEDQRKKEVSDSMDWLDKKIAEEKARLQCEQDGDTDTDQEADRHIRQSGERGGLRSLGGLLGGL